MNWRLTFIIWGEQFKQVFDLLAVHFRHGVFLGFEVQAVSAMDLRWMQRKRIQAAWGLCKGRWKVLVDLIYDILQLRLKLGWFGSFYAYGKDTGICTAVDELGYE